METWPRSACWCECSRSDLEPDPPRAVPDVRDAAAGPPDGGSSRRAVGAVAPYQASSSKSAASAEAAASVSARASRVRALHVERVTGGGKHAALVPVTPLRHLARQRAHAHQVGRRSAQGLDDSAARVTEQHLDHEHLHDEPVVGERVLDHGAVGLHVASELVSEEALRDRAGRRDPSPPVNRSMTISPSASPSRWLLRMLLAV